MKVVLVNDYKGRKKKKYSYDLYEVNRDNLELSKNYAENVQILQMNLQLEMEDYSENNFNYLGSANDTLPCGESNEI